MGFMVGCALGLALGIGLIVAFARYQNTRSKRRIDLAATVATFARMTVEDSRKLLPPQFYPPWVVFSQRQKLTWLNHNLDKIWPYVDEAASELIRNSVEPMLEQYRPSILASLKFSKLTLGTVAPQFTGISIMDCTEDNPGEIIMELELQWDGNPNIVLDIKTKVGVSIPIQVKNIGFTGVFRLILKPLVDEFPCFGAVCFSLREKKPGLLRRGRDQEMVQVIDSMKLGEAKLEDLEKSHTKFFKKIHLRNAINPSPISQARDTHGCGIRLTSAVMFCYSLQKNLDFTPKVIGGDISAIPGIADALESTLKDAIEDSITWPVRKIIPILPGDYSYLELKPVGTLEVKLIEAKELTNKDFIGKSDPFAKLFIRPLRARTKTSKTINNNTNPIWNEHFEFTVEDTSTQHLTVRVYDDEGIKVSEFIGCGRVALSDLDPGKVKDVWLKLVKDVEFQKDQKNRGQVHLELLYIPLSSKSAYLNLFDPDFRLTSLEKALKQGTGDGGDDSKKDIIIRGVLSVTVISAQDLPATDILGKSDPFVVLIMKKSEQKYKTRVLKDTLNPVWNQTFDFVVEDGLHELLMLEVYDHDTFGKDKVGRCAMTLTRAVLEGEFKDNFPIDGAKSGSLDVHLKWTPQLIIRD